MSCVQQLQDKGYYANPENMGLTVEPTRWGNASYKCDGGSCILVLSYDYKAFKRIRIKYSISIDAAGSNPTATYTCAAGFGITRLVLWVLDPMQKVFEAMGNLVQMIVILQLLTSLLSSI